MIKNSTRLYLLLALLITGTTIYAQDIIWGGPGDPNSEFADGLNDWTAVGIFCAGDQNGANALWIHSTTGLSEGGYASADRIESLSFDNGVAIFDSDYLDNTGNPANENGGPCPYLHRGELVSPMIDLSGQDAVILRFNQFFRWFRGPGSSTTEPPSSVHVSNDGGENFTKFIVNASLGINQATPTDDVVLLDISSAAANSSEVVIKFVFDGDAYYWMIDDVYLLGNLPENSLSMNRHYYAPTARYIPQSFAVADTFVFSARFSNLGGNEITDAYIKVEILDADLNVYFADSVLLDPIEVGTENRVVELPFTYVPEDLEPNQYFIRYSLYQTGAEDFEPTDNVRVSTFFITPDNFWQSGELRAHTSPLFTGPNVPWGWGSYFLTSEAVQDDFQVESVEVSVSGLNSPEDLAGNFAEITMMEIIDFSIGSEGTFIDDQVSNIAIALGEYELSPTDDGEVLVIELEDYLTFEQTPIPLENGKNYMVMVSVGADNRIGYDNAFINVPFSLGAGTNGSAALYWDGGFVGGTFGGTMPFIKLNLSLVTTVDERPLPEHTVKVFPNPASSYTQLALDFNQSVDATVTLADINGRVISMKNLNGILQHDERMDLSQLATGTYIIRVATADGTATRKISVIK